MIGGEEVLALLDTGCELSILNEQLYNKLRHLGLNCLELPTQHLNLVSAFNERSRRIRKQALLEIQIGDSTVDQVVLLSPQLLTDAILGLDFLVDNAAEISFPDRTVSLKINEKFCRLEFQGARQATRQEGAEASFQKQVRNFALRPTLPCATAHLSADLDTGQQSYVERTAAVTGDGLGEVSDGEGHTDIHQGDCLLIEDILPHCEDACDVTDFPATYDVPRRKVKRGCYDALGLAKEGQVADTDDSTCVREMLDKLCSNDDSADDARLCLTASYFRPDNVDTSQKSEANANSLDDRMIRADQLRAKVGENNILSPQQQNELYGILIKYQHHLTKRPGRCNVFEYEFKIERDMPHSANSRPIPFDL
jgi:hypothetical protein